MTTSLNTFSDKAAVMQARGNRLFRALTPGVSEAAKQFLSFASAAAIAAAIIGGIVFSFQSIKEYDKALASLSALTGLSGTQFEGFKKEIALVAGQTGKSSIEVAKAFEIIGGANSELLNSSAAMGAVSKSAITLSQASGDDLANSAESLVSVMNQFSLGANDAARVMNVLAAGAQVGAATIPQLSESMKNVGAVASTANLSVEQTVGLLEVLASKKLIGAEAGTKLRGSLVALQKAGLGYSSGAFVMSDALSEVRTKLSRMSTAMEQDAYIQELFGTENLTAGKILLGNTELIEKFTAGVKDTNIATEMAAKNMSSLDAILETLKNKWVTFITTSEKTGGVLDLVKTGLQLVSDNFETAIGIVFTYIGLMVGLKLALIAGSIWTGLYNISLGVYNALAKRAVVYTAAQSLAMRSQMIATRAITAAQWLWNIAMSANPIGLIIIGITALIGLVIAIIAYWDEWGSKVAIFLGPLGLMITLVMQLRHHFEMIGNAFSNGGFMAGIKAIGVSILDYMLDPIQKVLELITTITGADWAGKMAVDLANYRQAMVQGAVVKAPPTAEAMDRQASDFDMQDYLRQASIQQQQELNVNINDPTGRTTVDPSPGFANIKLTSTR